MEQPNVLLRVDLPVGVLQPYQEEADKKRVPLTDVLKTRLKRCQNHRSSKPLYFTDAQRDKLENLLGKTIDDADQALTAIAQQMKIKIGSVDVQLTDQDLRRLKNRFRPGLPLEPQLQEQSYKLIQRFIRGEL